MAMKGFLPLTLTLLSIIATATMIATILLVSLFFEYHLHINLKFEYDKSYSDLLMLSFLRLQYNSTYPGYKVLAERDVNGFTQEMKDFLKKKVELLGDVECFRIANSSMIIFSTSCSSGEPYEYTGGAFIFKPYNPDSLVEEFTLTYNKVKR
jgi:hypothetical protein